MGGEGGGEEGGLAVAAAAASGSLGHGDGGNGNGNGKQQSRDAADPAQQQQQHPLPPPPQCASPLGAGAGAPESAVTALEAFSPGTSPMKEGTGGEEEGGEGEGQGQDGRLGGGERAERTLYEASSEEERIVVDGLVSLLAAEGAEKEVDRLLDPFPPPISVASAAAAAEAALAVPPPLSSVHTPRGLVLGLEEPPQLEQPGDGPPALLVPPSSPRAGPVHVSQTGVRVLRRRFHDLKALADRQTELIKSQDAQIATLQQALRQEQATNGVRKAYLEAAGKAKAGALGLGAEAVGAELLPALPPAVGDEGGGGARGGPPGEEVETLQEEIARLDRLALDLGAMGEAAEAQLAEAKRVLVDHALGAGLPREVVPVRWVGAASRNEVREALREERRGLLKKEVLGAACRAVEAAICDERLDPFSRGPDGAITGVNRRLPCLQRLALEYGKGLVELVIAKKREIARFAPATGPQQPSAILWEDGRELPLADAMLRVLALLPRHPHYPHPYPDTGAHAANGHHRGGPAGSSLGAAASSAAASALAAPQPHRRSVSVGSAPAGSGGAPFLHHDAAAAGATTAAGGAGAGGAPLLILTREMEGNFQAWLRENTTTKLAAIQAAGGAVDGFLARVAAAALVAAAAAAGVEDVAPDELPLPRIATYDELKAFIEAHVAQCEREASNATKSLQKLWSCFLAFLGYADDIDQQQQQQQQQPPPFQPTSQSQPPSRSGSPHPPAHAGENGGGGGGHYPPAYYQHQQHQEETGGGGGNGGGAYPPSSSSHYAHHHHAHPYGRSPPSAGYMGGSGSVSVSSAASGSERRGGGGGGGGGGGRQSSILDPVSRQGFMDWMTQNTRANSNSQAGLLSAVNCCLRAIMLKHQAADGGNPSGQSCELDGNGLKAFIRRHQGEIDAQLERSTSCTLKTGFRYFYRFLDTLPRRHDSIVEDGLLGLNGGGGYARHAARFRPRAGTSESILEAAAAVGAAGGEEEADELELSNHGPTIPGGSVSSATGGGGVGGAGRVYYNHHHNPYHYHGSGYHNGGGGAGGGGGCTPTAGNGNGNGGGGGGGSSTNVPRGRLPAVLTGATQESFVNWLRLHTQLRQDASIRNALRAVNKFLRAASERQRAEDGRALAPGEPLPQLDRAAASGVMAREEQQSAAGGGGHGGEGGGEGGLITSATPGYAKTAWRYFSQYLQACREQRAAGRAEHEVDALLSEAAAAAQQHLALQAQHQAQQAAAAQQNGGAGVGGGPDATGGGWRPIPPALPQPGGHATGGGAKRKRSQSQGGGGASANKGGAGSGDGWVLAPEARAGLDAWLATKGGEIGGQDPATRAALLGAANHIVQEALAISSSGSSGKGGSGKPYRGGALGTAELGALAWRQHQALYAAAAAAQAQAEAAGLVPAARPALECLLQFLEEEQRNAAGQPPPPPGSAEGVYMEADSDDDDDDDDEEGPVRGPGEDDDDDDNDEEEGEDEERQDDAAQRAATAAEEEEEPGSSVPLKKKRARSTATAATTDGPPAPAAPKAEAPTAEPPAAPAPSSLHSMPLRSRSLSGSSTASAAAAADGPAPVPASPPPPALRRKASNGSSSSAAHSSSHSLLSAAHGGSQQNLQLANGGNSHNKHPRVLAGTARRGLLGWLRGQGQAGRALESFCSGVNRLLLALLRHLRGADAPAGPGGAGRELELKEIQALVAECSARGGPEACLPPEELSGAGGAGAGDEDNGGGEDLQVAWNILAGYLAAVEEQGRERQQAAAASAASAARTSPPRPGSAGAGAGGAVPPPPEPDEAGQPPPPQQQQQQGEALMAAAAGAAAAAAEGE